MTRGKLNDCYSFILFCIIIILPFSFLRAQNTGIVSSVEIQSIGTTNKVVPFWMRSNNFGSQPISDLSGSFLGRIIKDYDQAQKEDSHKAFRKNVDWGFGIEIRGNVGRSNNINIIQAYGKLRASVFQLTIGRDKQLIGLNGNDDLSSGNFSISGNALGIPKIELSIPNYVNIPILDGLFAFKGQFAHGWIGKTPVVKEDFITHQYLAYNPATFIHQKSLYGRIGREKSRLKIYGGFNHQAFWGNERTVYGNDFTLSNFETFFYVLTGKAYGADYIPTSKIGNQLGSVDIGFEYKLKNAKLFVYRQNFYDVGALSKLANIKDGLNGISLEKLSQDKNRNGFQWKKILFEFLYTKDQAGYPTSKFTQSGDEDYYNNFYYIKGWSYKNMGLGTPLITTAHDSKKGQLNAPEDYFINNRVIALHSGIEGSFKEITFKAKISYSLNYGTFTTSPYGKTTGRKRVTPDYGLFEKVNQLSTYLGVEKPWKNRYIIGGEFAFDSGHLLNNSVGIILKVRKEFN